MSESSGKNYLLMVGRRVVINNLILKGWEPHQSAGEVVAYHPERQLTLRTAHQYMGAPAGRRVEWVDLGDRVLAKLAKLVDRHDP